MTNTLRITITNVNHNNKYGGSYKKIFDIIESDIQFYNPFGTDEEIIEGSNFHIVISPKPESSKIEEISKLKNVVIG